MVRVQFLVTAVLALIVSGCGIVPSGDMLGITPKQARDNMARAQTAYATCMQQVPEETHICDTYKRLYDQDRQIYQSATAGVTGRQLIASSPPLDAMDD
jgi:hypothetical protein